MKGIILGWSRVNIWGQRSRKANTSLKRNLMFLNKEVSLNQNQIFLNNKKFTD